MSTRVTEHYIGKVRVERKPEKSKEKFVYSRYALQVQRSMLEQIGIRIDKRAALHPHQVSKGVPLILDDMVKKAINDPDVKVTKQQIQYWLNGERFMSVATYCKLVEYILGKRIMLTASLEPEETDYSETDIGWGYTLNWTKEAQEAQEAQEEDEDDEWDR